MKKVFHSTIDYSFLQDFLNQKPVGRIEEDDPNIDVWRDLLSFLRNKTEIDIDIPDAIVNIEENEPVGWFLKDLQDKYFQGEESLRFNTLQLQTALPKEFVEKGKKTKFIFYNNTCDTFLASGNSTGYYLFSGKELLKKWQEVINRPKLSSKKLNGVRKGSFSGWLDFQCYTHPFNAIIIVDNYLFSFPKNLEDNVFKLLKVLLPKSDLCTTIDIMIIASELYKYEDSGETVSINSLNNQIKKFLTTELNLRNFRLSLIKTSKKIKQYHDRTIFTNYFVIKSGYSFTVCGHSGFIRNKLETILEFSCDSLVNNNGVQTNVEYYNGFLEQISQIIRQSQDHTVCTENRLLADLN